MVQQLFSDLERLKDEVRRLKGQIRQIAIGGSLSPGITPGTTPVPPAVEGAMIVGNATPAWERLPPPTPSPGEIYSLSFEFGDTQPVWRTGVAGRYRALVYEVSGGTFTFVTDSSGNPVYTLEALE